MSKKRLKKNARRTAYAEKQEKKGRNIVKWIFGILIFLGVLYAIYSMVLFG